MRPKKSLKAEAIKKKKHEEYLQKCIRREEPGKGPYGLKWSELDRRAMAFTTTDGRIDVWTNPDKEVTILHNYIWPIPLKWCKFDFVRHPSYYEIAKEVEKEVDEEEEKNDESVTKSVTESADCLPGGSSRIRIRISKKGDLQFKSYLVSDIPATDYKNASARKNARQAWLEYESKKVPMCSDLNFDDETK